MSSCCPRLTRISAWLRPRRLRRGRGSSAPTPAAGAAIVVTDRCGVAECFAGRGALVVPYDEGPLRDALARLLGDPELRQRLGEEAREVAEEWSWPRVVELQEDVYRRAVCDA